MAAARSHGEAVNERIAAGLPIVPLHLPIQAVEWSCHAATTIKDAAGEVLAECSGHGRRSEEDVLIAAEIVRRVNAHDDLLAALQAFNIKEEQIIAGTADSLVLRIPFAVIKQAAAAIALAGGAS